MNIFLSAVSGARRWLVCVCCSGSKTSSLVDGLGNKTVLVYCQHGLGGPAEERTKAHRDFWFVDCTIMTDVEENLTSGNVI